MQTAFNDWTRKLLVSAGSSSSVIEEIGDYVLELFFRDGCEPTMHAMLDYAQTGLCGRYNVQVEPDQVNPSSSCTPNDSPSSTPPRP